jgi:hypothetical protein
LITFIKTNYKLEFSGIGGKAYNLFSAIYLVTPSGSKYLPLTVKKPY